MNLRAPLVLVLATTSALADSHRAGRTVELAAGIAHHQVVQGYDSDRSFDAVGVMPLAFSVGTFVTDRLALLFATTSSVFRHDRGDGSRWYLAQNLGVGGEYWLRADLAVGATAGLNLLMTRPFENHLARCAGLTLRGKWTPTPRRASAMNLIWEINGGVYVSYEVVVTSSLLVAWQWY